MYQQLANFLLFAIRFIFLRRGIRTEDRRTCFLRAGGDCDGQQVKRAGGKEMNTPTMPEFGAQIILMRGEDVESAVRRIIKEEIDQKEADRNSARVTTSQLVERWHVDRSTLWRWRKSGRLKGVKIGREITYKESDILKLLGE